MKQKSPSLKSHARAADQVQTSISASSWVFDKMKAIATRERRSRNRQIELFMERQIAIYEKENGPVLRPMAAEAPADYGKDRPK